MKRPHSRHEESLERLRRRREFDQLAMGTCTLRTEKCSNTLGYTHQYTRTHTQSLASCTHERRWQRFRRRDVKKKETGFQHTAPYTFSKAHNTNTVSSLYRHTYARTHHYTHTFTRNNVRTNTKHSQKRSSFVSHPTTSVRESWHGLRHPTAMPCQP